MQKHISSNGASEPSPTVELQPRPERQLIRERGSFRHIDLVVRVGAAPTQRPAIRQPLSIGLVLDRSGSMHGEKIATARSAALAAHVSQ